MSHLLTVRQAAIHFHIDSHHLRNAIADGAIPAYGDTPQHERRLVRGPGGREQHARGPTLRVRLDDVEAWIERRRFVPGSAEARAHARRRVAELMAKERAR